MRSLHLCRIGVVVASISFLLLLSGCTPQNKNQVSAQALFEDVAAQSGVRFTHTNGADGHFRYIESTPAGCAFLDYDNDGYQDILLLQSGPSGPLSSGQSRPHCALYHNNRNGTFTDVTAGSGLDADLGYVHGCAIGDYDNDGYDDIFITAYNKNTLLHNEGGHLFRDVTHAVGLDILHSTGYATSAAFGDYDNDGRLDLYVCYYAPWTPATDKACHDSEKHQDYCTPEIYDPEVHQLWHNEGTRFADVTHKAGIDRSKGRGLAVAFVDYDDDGRQDIFVANDLKPNMLWHNNGDGTFTNQAEKVGVAYAEGGQLMAGMGIGVADYDHSGHESLFVTNFSNQPKTLLRNMGDGLFEDVSMASGVALPQMKYLSFGCEFFDYDADSWADLIVANGHVQTRIATNSAGTTYEEPKQLFHNLGNAHFEEVTDSAQLGNLAQPLIARGLAIGDYDNDGRLDVLANNQNGPAQLLHNRDHSPNHWISFKTIGTKSNRDGYHARFTLTAGGITQMGTVRAGSSYLSHSDSRVYFGLGKAERVDRVIIQWPSGTHQTLENLSADRIYTVTEGKSTADTGRFDEKENLGR